MKSKLDLIAGKAKQNINMKFTSLIHHVNEENLLHCYSELKRNKACGIDGVTLEEYGKDLNENIKLLVKKLKTKKYRHKPVRRVYIPKPGKSEKRGLGIPALEDKLVQLIAKKIVELIFESQFLGCSHGFRPNLSCHTAIRALDQTVMKEPINYVVEVDVKKFFDNVSHYWLLRCIEERIADPNMIWLIKRFLKAGVVESGVYYDSDFGTPQGGIISPLLANIYLHYVLDLWFSKVILPKARDNMRLIRYGDDWLVCCVNKRDAEEFLEQLKVRLKKFNLEVADDKTKIIKFGRKEWKNRRSQKEKADSFKFLGFTHYLGATRKGWFSIKHKTAKQNLQQKLSNIKEWLKQVRNMLPLKEWWSVLKAKLLGHYRYYGVSGNYHSINQFYNKVIRMVFKWINRRSQKKSMNWQQYLKYLDWNTLPKPKIYYQMYETPLLCSNATLKSPLWEKPPAGFCEGFHSNETKFN